MLGVSAEATCSRRVNFGKCILYISLSFSAQTTRFLPRLTHSFLHWCPCFNSHQGETLHQKTPSVRLHLGTSGI